MKNNLRFTFLLIAFVIAQLARAQATLIFCEKLLQTISKNSLSGL